MTMYSNLVRRVPRLATRPERWELPDGDFLDVERYDPAGADPRTAPVVIVCHGLEGSSASGYVRGVQRELGARGVGSVALNFRSCSGELNRLPRLYHSGETSDLATVVDRIAGEAPGRALGLCGFSLGGNVVAKYLGERGDDTPVVAAVAVSVPFDLARCADSIDRPTAVAWLYRERFLRRLRRKAAEKAARHPGLIDVDRVRAVATLRAFDDAVTGPLHGFTSAADYYARSASGPHLPGVRRRTLLISAADDPLIPAESIPVAAIRANKSLSLELSPAGGHVGFVAGTPWSPVRWAERRAAEFLAAQLAALSTDPLSVSCPGAAASTT